jgi:hypothetical protein
MFLLQLEGSMKVNRVSLFVAAALGCATSLNASNILVNPGFEDPVVSGNGNHIGTVPTGWSVNTADNDSFNVVRIPSNGQGGSDQYLDLTNGGTYVYQSFVLTGPSDVDFGGYNSPRDGGTAGGNFQIYNSTNTVQIYTTTRVAVTATGTDQPWTLSEKSGVFLNAGTYVFRATFDDGANTDSDFVIPTSVPEPASLSLLGLGSLGLIARRRRA